jgi:hypothetical protein
MAMRFPAIEQLYLPCVFERLVPGKPHADGRRYLPLIVLRLPAPSPGRSPESATAIGVVDRHHVVDLTLAGRAGVARLVFLLSSVRLQPSGRQGIAAEAGLAEGRASTTPIAYGRVVAVPTWEAEQEHLPYESLYTELLLDVGVGIIGVRTSATAASLAETIGKPRIEPGDWLTVSRSRIDILGFTPDS